MRALLLLLPTLISLLAFATRTTRAWSCSSLDGGPFCPFVNQLEVPKHFKQQEEMLAKQDVNSVEQLLQRALKKLLSKSTPVSNKQVEERGAFEIHGAFNMQTGETDFTPVRWIEKPGETWMMISLRGSASRGFSNEHLFEFEIRINGMRANQCSTLRMRRVKPGWFSRIFDGTFVGEYTCSGRKTEAKLVLVHRKRGQPGGKFIFKLKPVSSSSPPLVDSLPKKASLPLRDRTENGCLCADVWTYNNKLFTNGRCGRAEATDKQPWCFVQMATCKTRPFGDNWDWCKPETAAAAATDDALEEQDADINGQDIVAIFHLDANGQLVM